MRKRDKYGIDELTSIIQDTINKNEDIQLSKVHIKLITQYFITVLKAVLESGKEVSLNGFGLFNITERESANPLNKEAKGKRRYVTFKAFRLFKDMLNQKAKDITE